MCGSARDYLVCAVSSDRAIAKGVAGGPRPRGARSFRSSVGLRVVVDTFCHLEQGFLWKTVA